MNVSTKDKTILAIDPSTKSTGWSIFINNSLNDYGLITAGSSNLFHRIDKMAEEINNIIIKYNPTEIVLEDVIPEDVRHNTNVYKALMYLQGYLLHTFDDNKISNYKFYTASEWRSKCGIGTGPGIKRGSLKPQDIAFVKKYYNINVNDDVADAICIGHAYTHKPIPKQKDLEVEIIDGFEFK